MSPVVEAVATVERVATDVDGLSAERLFGVYSALLQNIAREDSNSHNRIMWALSLTSGQFIAISFLLGKVNGDDGWMLTSLAGTLLLSGLGVFFCFRTRRGVAAAHAQIKYLKAEYTRRKPAFDALGLPRPFGVPASANAAGANPGSRSCVTYVQALLTVWSTVFIACAVIFILKVPAMMASDPRHHAAALACGPVDHVEISLTNRRDGVSAITCRR